MGNSARVLALLVFGIIAVGFLFVVRTQAPSDELGVLRALLTEWDAQFAADPTNPLASAIFISSPTDCHLSMSSDFPSESLFEAFTIANEEGVSPIRLSSLTDLVSVVSLQDARRWQGNTYRINVEGRQLIELSRVGISGSDAVMCVSAEGGGMLYLFEKFDGEWMFIAEHQRWVV